jgi:uncharacterized membrane protein HdeD (DUF308 family)
LIGVWAIAHGIAEIVAAIELHKIHNNWFLIVAGVSSVGFGNPSHRNAGGWCGWLILAIGAYLILFGSLLIGMRFACWTTHIHERPR